MAANEAGECHICEMVANDDPAMIVYRDAAWTASMVADVPGWVMLCANRHVEGGWSLAPDEAASFGPLYAAVAKAIREVCDAERVYLLYVGENALHFHALALPRSAGTPPEQRGPGIVARSAELADRDEALRLVPQLHDAVASAMPT
jgi:diadenosine tetraphosphate (Ap4A) HIT family hydrolase